MDTFGVHLQCRLLNGVPTEDRNDGLGMVKNHVGANF